MATMYTNFVGQVKSTAFIGSEQEAQIVHNFLERKGYSENYIKKIMYPNSPVKKYSRNEVSKAIAIHCQGSKAYEAIRRDPSNVMPLPHPKTLNRYISNFLCSPGLHPELFSIIGAKLSSIDVIGRQSILLFYLMRCM